jgi:hypothetical protein
MNGQACIALRQALPLYSSYRHGVADEMQKDRAVPRRGHHPGERPLKHQACEYLEQKAAE